MIDELTSPQDYIAIVKRRKWRFLLPVIAIFPICAAVAIFLPPVYRSSATILIEEPNIPRELVTSSISSYADQRLQSIYHRVTASQILTTIINKYDLYPEARTRVPLNEVITNMREAVTMALISADVVDPRSGRPGKATIAFTLAFDHQSPSTAQRVANELVTLFLSENLRSRQERAAETTNFLGSEAARLEREISDIEKRLGDLKERNVGSLPEQLQYNLQLIERAGQEQRDLDRRAQSLQERQIYLESQLLQISPHVDLPFVNGGPVPSSTQRLDALRTELIGVSAKYGPEHPDVMRMRREIEALEKETHNGTDTATLRRQLDTLRTELAVAEERYAGDHPDVVKLKRQVDQVKSSLVEAGQVSAGSANDRPPDNPAYIQLRAQLEAARSELRAITEQRAAVARKITMHEEQITKTPLVEREYLHLKRLQDDSTRKYHEIKSKQMAAQLGEALETERKSERFTMIEPPIRPTDPESPNRIAILFLGLVLSFGAGAGTAVASEAMDSTVYGARQVAAITGASPLAVIPYIETKAEIVRAWRRRILAVFSFVVVVSGAIAYVHYNVRPLEILWISLERRLDTLLMPYLW